MRKKHLFKRGLLWLKSSQEESPGVASSTRLAATLISACVMSLWTWTCLKAGHLVPLDLPLTGLVAGMWGAKVIQHFSE